MANANPNAPLPAPCADTPGLGPDGEVDPPAGDGRPTLGALHAAFDALRQAGWRCHELAAQSAPSGGTLPIVAYQSADDIDTVILGGIHGREPAGPVALARAVPRLLEHGRATGLLVMPLLNPWGYLHHDRYGPSGRSVSDSDHLLGRAEAPACPEADAITRFVVRVAGVRPGAAALDLHEDPVYEAPGYTFAGAGTYLYAAGAGAADHPAFRRVRACLAASRLPLAGSGVTRFGEALQDGVVYDSADGSIDELLAVRLGCSPVITVETLLHAPDSPPLGDRIAVYLDVIAAFLAIAPPHDTGRP